MEVFSSNPSKNIISPFWGEKENKMTDVMEKMIAVNCNQEEIQQMAVGSDVETIGENRNSAVDTQNLADAAEAYLSKEMPTAAEAINDNAQPTPPAAPAGQDAVVPVIEKEILSQEEVEQAIDTYKLQKMVLLVPPEKYKRTGKVSVSASITRLRYELALKPFLLSIPKRPGVHPGKGKPSKTVLVKNLYGLERYACEQIENLEAEWVEKAIMYAQEYNVPATAALSFRLKKEFEQKAREVERMQKQAEKNQSYADCVVNAPKASEAQVFNGAIVDLTQRPEGTDFQSMTLPLAENALVLIAVMPKELQEAMELLKMLGLKYIDNIVWNRDSVKGGYVWSINQHTNILLGIKGTLEEPVSYFRPQSDYLEHPVSGQKNLPDFYYDSMSNLVPGGAYLEVFSTRQYNDQWFSFDTKEDDNV